MNSIYKNNSELNVCCGNKQQCFTPTLLSWSSIQLTAKNFVNAIEAVDSETGTCQPLQMFCRGTFTTSEFI